MDFVIVEKGMKMMNDLTITIIVLVFALLVFAFCCLYEQAQTNIRKAHYIIARLQRENRQLHTKNEQLQKMLEWYKNEIKMLGDRKPYYKIGNRGTLEERTHNNEE